MFFLLTVYPTLVTPVPRSCLAVSARFASGDLGMIKLKRVYEAAATSDGSRKRYFAELDSKPKVWKGLVQAARRGPVTLIYSSRDAEHNNAVALKDYLQAKMKRAKNPTRPKLAA
jgi:Protein of unknown function, DUF488